MTVIPKYALYHSFNVPIETVGAVVSKITEHVAESEFPAASVTVQVNVLHLFSILETFYLIDV